MSYPEKPVLISEQSFGPFRVAQIELSAPKKLNALDRTMLKKIGSSLQDWAKDPNVAAIVLRSNLEKAFCAGGDVKGLVLAMDAGDAEAVAKEFFTTEYSVDHQIHLIQKPTVCIADGIAMGGGIGIMNGCQIRVVTENSILSMPELSIGLFPDVGASYFLPRLKQNIGWLMGLSGLRLTGTEAVHFGLADVHVERSQLRKLNVDLIRLPWTGVIAKDREILSQYFSVAAAKTDAGSSELVKALSKYQYLVDSIPNSDVDTALKAVQTFLESSPVFSETLDSFQKASPTSLRITHELLRFGQGMPLADCFQQEFNLAIQISLSGDFREGVRAQLIDKDRQPQWLPAPTKEKVQDIFARRSERLTFS